MISSDSRPTNVQIIRWTMLAFCTVVAALALWLVKDILMLSLTAIIIAILLTTPIRFMTRRGMPRPLAVVFTIVLVIVVIAVSTALMLPDLLDQFAILVRDTIPRAWQVLQRSLEPTTLAQQFPWLEGVLQGVNINDLTNQLSSQIVDALASFTGQVFPFLGNVLSAFVSLLIIIFLSLYFVADPDTHWRGMLRLVPVHYRARAREIMSRLDLTLRRFLQAQILLMVLTGTATTIALWLMKLPLAGVLGVITGLFSFVPNFGPVISLIPILAVAIINTPSQVLLLLLIFFAIQLLMSQVVAPLLLGQEVSMPPAVILLSQIIAGIFFGFLGLLLSVPLAAILIVLVREVYVRDILGDADVGQRTTREIPLTAPEKLLKS